MEIFDKIVFYWLFDHWINYMLDPEYSHNTKTSSNQRLELRSAAPVIIESLSFIENS